MHIEILEVNGFKINLPIGLERTMNTPVRDSYQEFLKTSTNDVRRHLTAATTLIPEYLPEGPLRVLHCFGGVGATAQIIDQAKGKEFVEHTFWERDPVLVEYLRKQRLIDCVVFVQNSFNFFQVIPDQELDCFDVLLMDMSVGTIKTPGVKDMWNRIQDWMIPERMVWFTDTACHKIHLNYKTYEKDFDQPVAPTAESYLMAYDQWLRVHHNLTITAAMREAGEYYCVVKGKEFPPFASIPYL